VHLIDPAEASAGASGSVELVDRETGRPLTSPSTPRSVSATRSFMRASSPTWSARADPPGSATCRCRPRWTCSSCCSTRRAPACCCAPAFPEPRRWSALRRAPSERCCGGPARLPGRVGAGPEASVPRRRPERDRASSVSNRASERVGCATRAPDRRGAWRRPFARRALRAARTRSWSASIGWVGQRNLARHRAWGRPSNSQREPIDAARQRADVAFSSPGPPNRTSPRPSARQRW